MFGGVDFSWRLWFVDLRIPESSFSKGVFIQISTKPHANYVTSAKYKFWWCKTYKVEDKEWERFGILSNTECIY
jgi:hypothetical protein